MKHFRIYTSVMVSIHHQHICLRSRAVPTHADCSGLNNTTHTHTLSIQNGQNFRNFATRNVLIYSGALCTAYVCILYSRSNARYVRIEVVHLNMFSRLTQGLPLGYRKRQRERERERERETRIVLFRFFLLCTKRRRIRGHMDRYGLGDSN